MKVKVEDLTLEACLLEAMALKEIIITTNLLSQTSEAPEGIQSLKEQTKAHLATVNKRISELRNNQTAQ